MQPRHVIPFGHCVVHIWSDDYLETVFPDGSRCPALFDYGQDCEALAQDLGYGTSAKSIRRMHVDHELGHTFLAECEGRDWSPNLRGVANRMKWPSAKERSCEEHRVLEFQRRLNGTDRETTLYLERFARFR